MLREIWKKGLFILLPGYNVIIFIKHMVMRGFYVILQGTF